MEFSRAACCNGKTLRHLKSLRYHPGEADSALDYVCCGIDHPKTVIQVAANRLNSCRVELRLNFIRRGKEVLPRASFADGGLYPQTLDQIAELGESALDPIGEIHFEFGGNVTAPYIVVKSFQRDTSAPAVGFAISWLYAPIGA